MTTRAAFDLERFLPRKVAGAITRIRMEEPEVIAFEAQRRRRRARLSTDGRLAVVAVDHPQRGVTVIGSDPLRMADRWEYLARAIRVLSAPGFDGIMGTPDFIEEVLVINHLVRKGGGPSIVDDKLLIGCMQRGGVAGVAGEIDDRFGAYTPEALEAMGLDGGKMMFRAVEDDERTLRTIDYCARAVTELSRRGLYAFVEPLPMRREGGRYLPDYSVETLVKYTGVAASLGETSRYTILKLPYIEPFDRIAAATTLPILLLGGPSKEDPTSTIQEFARGMRTGENVRGAMVGRNVTYPGAFDPAAVAAAVAAVIHDGISGADALAMLQRGEAPEGVVDLGAYL